MAAILAFFFYRSIWALFPMCLPGYWYFLREKKRRIANDRQQLLLQFRECILAMAAALKAGYGIENALLESLGDMKRLFGERALICRELEQIRRGLQLHIPLEEQLEDLGRRSGQRDISQFAQIFQIARKSGGNLSHIMGHTAEQISSSIDARLEAAAALSGRRMEQRIMRVMPIGILLYIEWSTPGYFDTLYHNVSGILIMTACLCIYLGAYLIGERMLGQISGG